MQKILFIVFFSIINLFSSYSQNIDEIKKFADKQFRLNNYNLALKEYQRVYFFDEEKKYNDLYKKIAGIYFRRNQLDNAIKFYNLAWQVEKNDSIKKELVFYKAICHLKGEHYLEALNEIYDMPETNSDYFSKKIKLYEGICQFGLNNFDASYKLLSQLVDSTGTKKLASIFTALKKFNKKYNPDRIEKMSRIVPGLGQIYAKDWKNGINSIALILLVSYYSVLTAYSYSYLDGALIMSSWFTRYYSGGALKARNIAEKRLLTNQSIVYQKIMQIIKQHQAIKSNVK
jgi:tetratricopeptide (TPR) repeat protein